MGCADRPGTPLPQGRWPRSVAFSPDGKRLASGSGTWDDTKRATSAGEVKVWDAQTGQELLTLKGHTGRSRSVAFSPDGKRLASGIGTYWTSGEVKVWDAQTGQELLTLKGHTGWSTAWPSARTANAWPALVGQDTVKVWDAQTGQELLTLKGHTDWSTSVAFSPDGKRLASGDADRTVKVWDAQTGQELLTFKGHTGWSTAWPSARTANAWPALRRTRR